MKQHPRHNRQGRPPRPGLRPVPAGFLAAGLALLALAGPGPAAADAPAGHDGLSCRLCHGGEAAAVADPLAADRVRQARCLDCHREAAVAGTAPSFHGRGRCLDCHDFHRMGTVTTTAGNLALADLAGVDRAHCRGCHDGKGSLADLSAAHRAAGRLYHENAAALQGQSPSTPCLWCHSDGRATDWQAVPASDRIAFPEHASHPFGEVLRPGTGPVVRRIRDVVDPRLPLPAGRIECVTCHQLTARTKDRLIPFASPKELCLGCHDLGREPERDAAVLMAGLGRR